MPITDYKVIVATTVEELTNGVIDDGMVPVGDLDPSTADWALQAAGTGTYDVGSAENFEVVVGTTPEELADNVNAKIAQGLQPVGGVFCWHRAFMQAMGNVTASGGGEGGGGAELPEGAPFQVLGFDANKDLKAMKSGMAQWLGEDRQIGGNAFDFVPVVYLTGKGQRVSEGVPNLLGLSNSPISSSIAIRDSGGVLSGATASRDTELPNLKQVREMIEDVSGGPPVAIYPEGKLYDVLSFDATGLMKSIPMSMELWAGKTLPMLDAATDFIPVSSYAAGGKTSTQGWGTLHAEGAPFTIPVRDNHGRMSAERGAYPQNVVTLQQVQEMIATSRKEIEDGIIDIINGAINGGSK